MDYLDFLSGVLLARTARDTMDCSCSPGHPVELWLDIELENIEADPVWTDEDRRELILTSRLAELIDDRKGWLLEEIRADIWRSAIAA